MRVVATLLGVVASLVMLGVSGSMNYLFMSGLGKSALEGQVLGAASAAADGLKALLPFFIWWAWQYKRRIPAILGSGVWLFFVGFSLLSAIGFSATNRGAVTDTREGMAATFETVQADLQRAEARLAALPAHRPAQVVQQTIEGLKQNRRWTSTSGCTDATASASRSFCEGFFQAKGELAAAVEGERLRRQIEGLKREVQRLRKAGAGQDTDPQVSLLSKIFGQSEGFFRISLIVVVALLVELGSSMGLWLSTAHLDGSRRPRDDGASTEVRAEVMKPSPSTSTSASASTRIGPVLADTGEGAAAEPLKIEAEVMGDVQDYCLARLQPVADEVSVSIDELFADYVAWCEGEGLGPHGADTFSDHFGQVAEAVDLVRDGQHYIGIKLGRKHRGRAA